MPAGYATPYTPPAQPQAQQGTLPSQQAPQQQGSAAQPVYMGAPPQANATYSSFNTDPSAIIQQIMSAFAPQQANMQNQYNQEMAASGLQPGMMAPELMAQETSALAPSLGNAIQFAQGQGLEQSMFNTGNANQFTLQNVADLMNTNQFNTEAANNMIGQQMNAFTGLNSQGLGGAQNLAQMGAGNYGQMSPMGGDIANAFNQFGQNFGGQQGTPFGPGNYTPGGQPMPTMPSQFPGAPAQQPNFGQLPSQYIPTAPQPTTMNWR